MNHEEGRKYTVVNLARHHLSQVIQLGPPVMGQINIVRHALRYNRKNKDTPAMFQPGPSHDEILDKTKLNHKIYKITGL